MAALGGDLISSYDSTDVYSGISNPANLQESHAGVISLNFLPLRGGIRKSSVAYASDFKKLGLLNFSIQHVGYGDIDGTDQFGNSLGSFSPQEYAITIGKSFEQGPFSLGASFKFAGAHLASYSSFAVLTDLGGTWVHPHMDLRASLLIKNLGFSIKSFVPGSPTNVPLNPQLGISFKPEHMPVRFHLTAHNLHRYDIQFLDPNNTFEIDENGDQIAEEKQISEQIFRHITVGAEILLFKNLQFRMGYSHLRRKELKAPESGGAGFSFGGILRIKRIAFEFSRAYFFAGQGSSVISINTLLGKKSTKTSTTNI